MPRFPRSYIQTSYFHVMTQGINKSYIFNKHYDKIYYIELMYKNIDQSNVEIIAYCIMDNHTHLLLKVNNLDDLIRYMHKLNTKYAQYYNRKYKRVGYVFRDRYKTEGIYSEKQLCACIKYIYNNPVKAKICSNPEEYKYSNCEDKYDINDDEYVFMDVEENSQEEIIDNYFLNNGIDVAEIINDKIRLKEAIIELKENKGISLRKIAEKLDLNRERVRKIYKQ